MYSFSTMKSERKPPLPRSPIRLRSRLPLNSSKIPSLQTPPGSLAKYQKPTRSSPVVSGLRPEYHTISCELRALSEMVREEFAKAEAKKASAAAAASCSVNLGTVFQRGRLYDEYSARRNERLKRKKGVAVDEGKPSHSMGLGVTMESAKKYSSRKIGSIRKSVSAAYSMDVNETPRYMLRSMSKENKKPPLAAKLDKVAAVGGGGVKKVATRRSGRI